ncbi:MAG: hypothetical protein NC924_02920 [Candidatus Omnitrophica bacterium]|nr:hypothetical protein [Candidatus Omnitrophota bacterium]
MHSTDRRHIQAVRGVLWLSVCVFVCAAALLAPRAGAAVVGGYVESGARSTAEDYEDAGADDDYTYRKYHLRYGSKDTAWFTSGMGLKVGFDLATLIQEKDYQTKDSLDNRSRSVKAKWLLGIVDDEGSIELSLPLAYKEKRYSNSPQHEYDRLTVAPAVVFREYDIGSIDISGGITSYDYAANNDKDQLNIFGKIGASRYLLDQCVLLSSSYRVQSADEHEIGRRKTKQEVMGGLDIRPDWPWLRTISHRLFWGQRDTRDDEERDEDYDYEYWRYYTKTTHKINKRLKTDLKYEYFKKDYLSAAIDHRGFSLLNSWDYELLADVMRRVWFGLDAEYKNVRYAVGDNDDYTKERLALSANYQQKKNWKAMVSVEDNYYDQAGRQNDRNRWYARLRGEKWFRGGDFSLTAEFKYRYTDYRERNTTTRNAVRAGAECKF